MTSPFASKISQLITGSLRHELTATAVTREGTRIPLDVEDGALSVTFDESWSPYGQASLRCAVPQSQEILDSLDSRLNCRLELEAGYTYPDNETEIFPLADLGLRNRAVSRPSNTMDLDAATDEARAQDQRAKIATNIYRSGINEAAGWCLMHSLYPETATILSDFPPGSFADDLTDLEINHGEDMWNSLEDIASRTGKRIYCDEFRNWRITNRPEISGVPAHELTVGEAGTILRSDTTLARDGWYNSVIVVHRWTPEGAPGETKILGTAHASSGEYAVQTVGSRVYYETSDKPIGQAQADAKASARLRNLISRGRSLSLSAIAAYWLRPGMTISVTLPTGEPELHLIQSIVFQPLAGLMDITTRQPTDIEITTGE